LLKTGDVLLYLDGLNEMGAAGPDKAKRLQQWLSSDSAPQRVVITCRIADYAGDLDLKLSTVRVQEMDEAHIRQFATNYLSDRAEPFLKHILPESEWERRNSRHLFHLARNPYMLGALVYLYQHIPDGDLPRNTGTLFRELVRRLWELERDRDTLGWIPFEQMEQAF
jgi:hypothetical protein